jgi:hypothetical protein
MFKVEVDKTKNLLKDHFAQRVDAGEAQRYAGEIQLFLVLTCNDTRYIVQCHPWHEMHLPLLVVQKTGRS